MRKTLAFFFALLWCTLWLQAKETRVSFGLGYAYHNYQDTRFSDHQFSKFSVQPELGFKLQSGKNTYSGLFTAFLYSDSHPAMEYTNYSMIHADLRFNYLREIQPGFSIGGSWDLLDYTLFDQPDLGNSSNTFLLSSDFLVASTYQYSINDSWKLVGGLDLGLLSLAKMAPSFTANFEQKVVDDGGVSFQDPNSRNPFQFKYINVKPFWEQLYVRTNVEVFYKKRLSVAYLWRMRSIWEQKGYPITQANHNVSLRFYFVSRVKNANLKP